jgi:hypothetical protein
VTMVRLGDMTHSKRLRSRTTGILRRRFELAGSADFLDGSNKGALGFCVFRASHSSSES